MFLLYKKFLLRIDHFFHTHIRATFSQRLTELYLDTAIKPFSLIIRVQSINDFGQIG